MKIRIGNDIRLRVHLSIGNNVDVINVLSIKAVFVNSTLQKEIDKRYKNKNRFIGRFPIEPFLNEYEPTEFCINSTGNSKYHVIVQNPYSGFGPNPKWSKCLPEVQYNVTEYQAEVNRTQDPEIFEILFPAFAQQYCGEYSMVLVLQVYDSTYKNNTRTLTIDKQNVFELVATQDEADTNGIDFDNSNDIYVAGGLYSDNVIHMYRTDGGTVNISVDEISGWHEG